MARQREPARPRSAAAVARPLGGANRDNVIAALRRASPYLRGQLAHEIEFRTVPILSIEADTSFDYATHIDTLLRQSEVSRDLEAKDDESDDDSGDVDDTTTDGKDRHGR